MFVSRSCQYDRDCLSWNRMPDYQYRLLSKSLTTAIHPSRIQFLSFFLTQEGAHFLLASLEGRIYASDLFCITAIATESNPVELPPCMNDSHVEWLTLLSGPWDLLGSLQPRTVQITLHCECDETDGDGWSLQSHAEWSFLHSWWMTSGPPLGIEHYSKAQDANVMM